MSSDGGTRRPPGSEVRVNEPPCAAGPTGVAPAGGALNAPPFTSQSTRDLAVAVRGLGKAYTIRHDAPRYDTMMDAIVRVVTQPFRRLVKETFWALQDVSFDVKKGEVLGVIGRNGAGKSTLLKILSQITEPTKGGVNLYGRVASLLEVGTGFHPELTGRENIYLNGAILGMRKSEIDRQFDAIVDFAGTEQFLDTPVKRYSSGMYVRLAFAVAAHLEPEILLVDEVLSVGDAEFQKKCLGKMEDVANSGRTVVFVSHNMAAIRNLCHSAVVMERGRASFRGPSDEAIGRHLSVVHSASGKSDLRRHLGRRPGLSPILQGVSLKVNGCESSAGSMHTGDDIVFEIAYECTEQPLDRMVLAVSSTFGERVFTVGTHLCPDFRERFAGCGIARCSLPSVLLAPGEYRVLVAIGTTIPGVNIDAVDDAMQFTVRESDFFGTGGRLLPGQGPMAQRSRWQVVA